MRLTAPAFKNSNFSTRKRRLMDYTSMQLNSILRGAYRTKQQRNRSSTMTITRARPPVSIYIFSKEAFRTIHHMMARVHSLILGCWARKLNMTPSLAKRRSSMCISQLNRIHFSTRRYRRRRECKVVKGIMGASPLCSVAHQANRKNPSK